VRLNESFRRTANGGCGVESLDLKETTVPLTTAGIAIQILSSLRAHRAHAEQCTVNDCKVVVNHLIRKFSEPLGRTGEGAVRKSKMVLSGGGGNTVRDHAVPVIVLLEQLLQWPDASLEISPENVSRLESFLRDSLLVVEITRDEDRLLSQRGYQRDMPDGWNIEVHALFRNPLARYQECGIEV